MTFGIGVNTENIDAGMLSGKQEDIACDCWFSSSGKTIPRFIKYQDKDGVIHSVRDIHILTSEKKRYCGIPMIEYTCEVAEEGVLYAFTLIFHVEECKWKMIIRE